MAFRSCWILQIFAQRLNHCIACLKWFGLAPFYYEIVKTEGMIRISVLTLVEDGEWVSGVRFGNRHCISDNCVSSLGVMAAYILCATINRRKVEKFLYLVYRVHACLIKTVDCHKTMCVSIAVGIVTIVLIYLVLFIVCSQRSWHFGIITIRCTYFLFHILGTTTYFQFVYSVLLLKKKDLKHWMKI